jgi:LIM domain kinase 1
LVFISSIYLILVSLNSHLTGNLRNYIHDKHKPFPWAMRISFATDIARALAYLHARRCIHRDLKGENLLVTANGRLKITDFGFARIAARNADESRRLTFCGTDSYMSPEILMGNEFDLPTDIFSLGVIFCEIAARRLADDRHFKRAAPFFSIDEDEVRKSVSPGCPEALVQLCLDCLQTEPSKRPVTRDILLRLTEIEAEILLRPGDEDQNVGSIKFATGNKRPGIAPRIPSFGMGIGKDIRTTEEKSALSLLNSASSDEESEDEDLKEAISKLKDVDIGHGDSHQALLHSDDESGSNFTDYSTTVIRGHPTNGSEAPPALSSMLTIRSPHSAVADDPLPAHNANAQVTTHHPEPTGMSVSAITIDSYRTANSNLSIAAATEGGSTIRVSPSAMVHRFTLIKTGARKASTGGGAAGVGSVGIGGSGAISPRRVPTGESRGTHGRQTAESNGAAAEGWSPFDFFFASGMLSSKCDVCNKRIGWKPALECDDCGLRWVFFACLAVPCGG